MLENKKKHALKFMTFECITFVLHSLFRNAFMFFFVHDYFKNYDEES